MQLRIIDNVECNTVSVLNSAIDNSIDVRIAVAFVSSDGLLQIMPSITRALNGGAHIEFMVGMDAKVTDPEALRELYNLFCKSNQTSLLCFISRNTSAIYHPKMYLTRDEHYATAIIGSSNLTRHGLALNIEANVVIRDDINSEIISDIYSTYNRLKYHPNRVIPDAEFVELFEELCRQEKIKERRLEADFTIKRLKEIFVKKACALQRPRPSRKDLVGWLGLVYDSIPEGRFTNQEIYKYENEFRQRYPQNLNIRAKIRQQLQLLQRLGFIEHISRGVWEKVNLELPK